MKKREQSHRDPTLPGARFHVRPGQFPFTQSRERLGDRTMPAEKTERRVVHFSGRVQGVGFRYTTRQIAGGFAVTGYVQNLPDGRVRLVAEGLPGELDRFQARMKQSLDDYIGGAEQDTQPASGEYSRFEIRH